LGSYGLCILLAFLWPSLFVSHVMVLAISIFYWFFF
jgi:hypothetical protein